MFHINLEQNKPLWQLMRKITSWNHVSASEMGSVLGLNRFKSWKKLRDEKCRSAKLWATAERNSVSVEDLFEDNSFINDAMRNGHAQEHKALEMFQRYYINKYVNELRWAMTRINFRKPGSIIWPQDNLSCSPDGVVFVHYTDPIEEDEDLIIMKGIEVKTPWKADKIPTEVIKIDLCHYLQCQTSLLVTRAHCWYLIYFDYKNPGADNQTKMFEISPDHTLWNLLRKYTEKMLSSVDQDDDEIVPVNSVEKSALKLAVTISLQTHTHIVEDFPANIIAFIKPSNHRTINHPLP